MRPSIVLLLVVAAALPPLPAFAQRPARPALPSVDSSTVIVFSRSKGSQVVGRVVAADDSSLTVVTLKGAHVALPRGSVESWRVRRGTFTARGFRDIDRNTSRLFFGPTARTLERGGGYVAAYDVFVFTGAYGVRDRVMFSLGASMMEDSRGNRDGPAWVDARVGILRSPKVAFAVGALSARWAGPGGGSISNGYAVVTLGSNDHAVTVMGGYPFARNNIANEPTFMLGGETRISSRLKLLTEVWRVPETPAAHTAWGVRWFGDRIAVSVGAIHRLDSHLRAFPVGPWLDIAFHR